MRGQSRDIKLRKETEKIEEEVMKITLMLFKIVNIIRSARSPKGSLGLEAFKKIIELKSISGEIREMYKASLQDLKSNRH